MDKNCLDSETSVPPPVTYRYIFHTRFESLADAAQVEAESGPADGGLRDSFCPTRVGEKAAPYSHRRVGINEL
jgi:hypothetical protein